MTKIEEYMLLPKKERQAHLRLSEPCIERGVYSANFRGLLAHILDTTINESKGVHCCHACNNDKCSNPYHLYWGTAKENSQDAKISGATKNIWNNTVAKHGLEKATELVFKNPNRGMRGKHHSSETRIKIQQGVIASILSRKN